MIRCILTKAALPVLSLSRTAKRFVVLTIDVGLCVFCVWLALGIRLGSFVVLSGPALWASFLAVATALPVFVAFGLYRAIFRYAGWQALMAVTFATAVFGLVYTTIIAVIGIPGIPRTVGILVPVLVLLCVGASRAMARLWLGGLYQDQMRRAALPRSLIYGAGATGRRLAVAMVNSQDRCVIGFLDDDDRLHGHRLDGLPLYSPDDLPSLVATLDIREVILALSSISRDRRNQILARLLKAGVAVRTVPEDPSHPAIVVDLDVDDVLMQEATGPNHILLSRYVSGRVVLVTGAGGVIGSELCRQLMRLEPQTILLVDHSEYALAPLYQSLLYVADETSVRLIPLLASVCDEDRMHEIMATWKPDIIYHAAAYKNDALVEHNPVEAIKVNTLGVLTVASAALEHGVPNCVLVSTDQAMCPTTIMGASKRLAEMILQSLAGENGVACFSSVRFGVVFEPSDAILPRMYRQIREGGPVLISHPQDVRCFMRVEEAACLIIQAAALSRGGEIFRLDMGQPVLLGDLARRMIAFSGLTVREDQNPDGTISIDATVPDPTVNPVGRFDSSIRTSHPRILMDHEPDVPVWSSLQDKLDAFSLALAVNDVGVGRRMLEQMVPSYQPGQEIVDWILLEQEAEADVLEGH
ncbi:polysaccharide biosynthesis protein [Haematospirillum jordaniae]|uniref:Capsular biosynthesis protein n=1 Tax=Haematospirillum jordaniae TaxID=1549855 RepID=A0A143DD92_9PROT|nr:polysaccharide biosynthesis protein [Haematospirillum jordaniae]AMW34243.1 capsular biosynthesis protein [Haematospirillum jordaniae]NKD45089.1 polysaccharide biosynthesis protein [Haematospirillum jordaniae]NKD57092.1 polysaccharide biosynthesis protein [Haematospirillum jordaniae]NKD67018.1 polysaccharide biosynthesis protein [Haematospirillum jordaniae]NKD79395.1 polysaccharide biosynthesis protein [Haematospirillum jordaniae]